jgi:ATP adenylyltransferase
LFCAKARVRDQEKAGILFRGDKAFVALNSYPYNSGHLMVAPYRHLADLEKLGGEETVEILELVQRSVAAIKTVMRPQGFNVGFNLGRPAGAGIVNHLHVHVVPRWNGDTNFMPVLSRTRVISQSLQAVYRLLRTRF